MALKIRGLEYNNAENAIKSVLKMERMKISDDIRMRDAKIIRHVANIAAKRSSSADERANYKNAVSVYASYIIRLRKRMKDG